MELRRLSEWSSEIKVHRLLCFDLKEFVDRISLLFSALESARPRCKPGVQALCSLQIAMDKANLLIQHCSASTKFYLAITANAILLRCERIRNALALSMNQVRNFVPPSLAAKISGILNQLISRKFHLETSEHEAGIALLSLLKHGIPAFSNSIQWELGRLQLAALRLNIISPAALLIERRAIRRLLGKFHQVHPRKEKTLGYLFHLLNKHGNFILGRQSERVDSQLEMEMQVKCDGVETAFDNRSISEPPEEFKCPISGRLFYDPVVIASGETFERAWIEYWFNNGKLTCPVTCRRLNHFALTSNVAMKSIITRWCSSHGINIPELPQDPAPTVFETKASSSSSITSFGGHVDDLQFQVSNLSLHSSDSDSRLDPPDGQSKDHPACQLPEVNTTCQNQFEGNFGITLSKLTDLSWGSQCEIVARFRQLVKENDKSWQSTFSESSLLVLIRFLKCANELCNVEVQKDGAEVLLAILSLSRTKLPPCEEDVIYMLASMLDSELSVQALALLDILSRRSYYGSRIVASGILPCILKMFNDGRKESRKLAMKTLCNLSENGDHIGHHIVYLDNVQKLTSLLADPELAGYGIQLVKRLCEIEEVRSTVATTVAENKSFTGSIARLLECGSPENQEHALDVLMALCREQTRFRWLILTDRSIVQYLGNISEDGKCCRGQAIALELLSLQHQIKAGVGIDPSSPDKKGPSSQPASEELYQRALRWIRKRA